MRILTTRSGYTDIEDTTKILKKFQLDGCFYLLFCSFAKYGFNFSILLVCDCKHAYFSGDRHYTLYALFMYNKAFV